MGWARRWFGIGGPIGLLLALSLPLPAALRAQAPAGPGDAIVVTGQRDRDAAIRGFIDEVTVASDDQIAAFDAALCPASYGLPPGHNQVVSGLIRQAAARARIRVAPLPCRPNVVVIVAENGAELVALLRRERPVLFNTLEQAELHALAAAPGPVRSWQVIEPRGADGRPMEHVSFLQIGGGGLIYIGETQLLTGVRPSLTERPTRQDLTLSLIVFDLAAIEGLSLRQLAAYAAMRTLARTDPPAGGRPPGRTILTLFDDRRAGRPPAEGLTRWDSAYLASLYAAGRTLAAPLQRSTMTRVFGRALAESDTDRDAPDR